MSEVRKWSEEDIKRVWAEARAAVKNDLPLLVARRRRAEKRAKNAEAS